ncbi:MAG: DUF503 domain-containing protein [Acidobacteriaceae bacterium]|jgi:uncharacterized protein YlxP (DUF503 family)|nr:DUF503 domain-containing protein [Acidobacteriaceae bacterium]
MPAVGVLHLELHLDYAQSIKEKRNVIRGLKARLRSRFNVAIAETGHQDSLTRGLVAVVTVAPSRPYAEALLQKVEDEAAALLGATLTGSGVEWME